MFTAVFFQTVSAGMSIPEFSNLSDHPRLNLTSNSFTLSKDSEPLKNGLVEISLISFKFLEDACLLHRNVVQTHRREPSFYIHIHEQKVPDGCQSDVALNRLFLVPVFQCRFCWSYCTNSQGPCVMK